MAELGHAGVSGVEIVSTAKRESEELHLVYVFAVAPRPRACMTGP